MTQLERVIGMMTYGYILLKVVAVANGFPNVSCLIDWNHYASRFTD